MGVSTDKGGTDRRMLEGFSWPMCAGCCCCGPCAQPEVLGSVATSQLVPSAALLTVRLASLVFLVLGGIWITWRSRDLPLCLPDWSYISCTVYFAMALVACLRHRYSSLPSEESSNRASLGSSITLLFFESSVVFQTIAVVVAWLEYAGDDERRARALLSTFALGVVLVDFVLNRCKVQVKHVWVLLAILLAWVAEQVLWVSAFTGGEDREACYEGIFDADGLSSLAAGAGAALAVVALALAYAAVCAKRDKLMVRCGFSPDPGSPLEQGDVEEDVGEDVAVPRSLSLPTMTLRTATTLRAPSASERASVVNPIFAGAGSRMKRKPWPHAHAPAAGGGGGILGGGGGGSERRTSLASIETDMSSGDLDAAESSGRHSRESPAPGAWGAPPPEGRGRRADWGAGGAAGAGGAGVSSHPSSWAGYGGGGAAAWVRSAKDATPPAPRGGKGGKGGHRRTNLRY